MGNGETTTPTAIFIHAVEPIAHRLRWLPAALVPVFMALSTIFFIFGQDLESGWDTLWILVGVLFFLAAYAVGELRDWWRRTNERGVRTAELHEAARLRVAMKNALSPLLDSVGQLACKPPAARRAGFPAVASQAVTALTLLLKDIVGMRVVVYRLSADQSTLSVVTHHGRADRPGNFYAGTPRGDSALEMVLDGDHRFVEDLDDDPPAGYAGTQNGYKTFISVAIHNGTAYGMVTVDAPNAGDLQAVDFDIVKVVSEVLSIAFAVTET